MSEVHDPATAEALDGLVAAVDALVAAGVTPHDAGDARTLITELETATRRLQAVQVDLVDEIDRTGTYRTDGHFSAKVMVRHEANLSGPEAHRRATAAKTLRAMPEVREAFSSGRIGRCQVERVAKAHANPRIRAGVSGTIRAPSSS